MGLRGVPGVGPADADVVEPSGVAEGDGAGGADDVGADPVVAVGVAAAGGGLGPGGVDGGRGVARRRPGTPTVRAAGTGLRSGSALGLAPVARSGVSPGEDAATKH